MKSLRSRLRPTLARPSLKMYKLFNCHSTVKLSNLAKFVQMCPNLKKSFASVIFIDANIIILSYLDNL